MYFAVADITCNPLLPFSAAFTISLFTSVAGISGAFLLLPFQISVLGYSTPSVSATNQLFNIVACPGGIYKFWKEGRLLLPLVLFMAAGTLPGVFIGAIARATVFKNADKFMIFAGLVLGYIGLRLLIKKSSARKKRVNAKCSVLTYTYKFFIFEFNDEKFEVKSAKILLLSMMVGIIGGIYGIGGGGIISPFLVSLFRLPVHAIAGACLFTTFLTSILGVFFYSMLALFMPGIIIGPDWLLGLILGAGGLLGMYFGASVQKYISQGTLKLVLGILQTCIAINFIIRGFNF